MSTTFLQVSDNSRTRCANNALNNTTSPITLNNIDTTSFDPITTGYIVTIWDDLSYPDPGDDPNMEKAFVSAITIGVDGSMTLTRSGAIAHSNSPKIALLGIARHINDLAIAVNNLENNPIQPTPAGNDSYIQFNDNGLFGGTANLEYDKTHAALKIGQPVLLPDNPLAVRSYLNSYSQINHQNASDGTLASTDYVATADNGTDSSNYIDMGINSSTYNDPSYSAVKANDGYVLNNGGDLTLGTLSSSKVINFITGGSTVDDISATIDDSGINITGDKNYYKDGIILRTSGYAGLLQMPNITDNGDGTITVSSSVCLLYSTDDFTGNVTRYVIPTATLTPTDNDNSTLCVNYNSGNPIYTMEIQGTVNWSSTTAISTVNRSGNVLEFLSWDGIASGLPEKTFLRLLKTERFVRESGILLGESATRKILITSGKAWNGVVRNSLSSFSSDINQARLWYHSSGVWTNTIVTQYNNTQYDDGNNLALLGNSHYAVNWVYRLMDESSSHVEIVLGTNNYQLADAISSQPPASLPSLMNTHCFLVGRIIVEKGVDIAQQIDSSFTSTFTSSPITEHASLGGLDYLSSGHTGFLPNTATQDNIADGITYKQYSLTEKNKLAGIATGAEVNVQSDWNQSNTSADDYIKNKPVIPSGVTPASTVVSEITYGQAPSVGSSTNYARADHTHGTPAASGGGVSASLAIAYSVAL